MNKLTKAEEEIMNVLWDIDKGFVKEIIEKLPEPKPAYNTVSTIIRILCTKGFVDHEDFGRSHRYYPLINKDEYKSKYLKNVVNRFFDNSYKNLVSFFSESDDLSLTELEELKKIIEKQMEKKK
jgi:predicted transcriptional regulator